MPEKTTNINFRVSMEEKAGLLTAALIKRITVSQYVRRKLGLKAKGKTK